MKRAVCHDLYDERSDVSSLGAILYLLLTRCAPVASSLRVHAGQNTASNGEQWEHRLITSKGQFGFEGEGLIPLVTSMPHLPEMILKKGQALLAREYARHFYSITKPKGTDH